MTSHIPFRKIAIPLNPGSEPDVIEIDDAAEAVGDWPEVIETCPQSPHGQHEYSIADNFIRCMPIRLTHTNAEDH